MEWIGIFFAAVLINNVILTQFLGVCPFLGVSKKTSAALGMGAAVTVVITIASIFALLISRFVLVPLNIQYMDLIVYIMVIASTVQLLEMVIKKFSPSLYRAMGIYLPLITTNCAVLGTAIIVVNNDFTFFNTVVYALGISAGFTLVMYLFAGMREQLEKAPVPIAFKGLPIALLVAAIMSIAFYGLSGIF